jgi:hypothetical protein
VQSASPEANAASACRLTRASWQACTLPDPVRPRPRSSVTSYTVADCLARGRKGEIELLPPQSQALAGNHYVILVYYLSYSYN